jgi:signal transduction histidine kinase
MPTRTSPSPLPERLRRAGAAAVRAFHAYAAWLVGLSWRRFVLLGVLLVAAAGILEELPPFSWLADLGEPAQRRSPVAVTIDEHGVQVRRGADAASGASGASAASSAAPASAVSAAPAAPGAPAALAASGASGASAASTASAGESADAEPDEPAPDDRGRRRDPPLSELALLWVLGSAIVKASAKGRLQAEARAAQSAAEAQAAALEREVVQARLAALQAQVEPHFLFNTLASIDHLIETDPPRASRMQKNLIALLRERLPGLRDAPGGAARDLGYELAVVRPYLELLQMRMEERLRATIDVPAGLHSAEFPPMVLQSLVENAVRHGLEPKAEGGALAVRAEVAHGRLVVSVADTGLGFGRAVTGGTGVGLTNIRERLALLYGGAGTLTIAENPGGGTVATIAVPYRSLGSAA